MKPSYTIVLGAEDRDTVVNALLHDATATIEAGSPPYTGETLRLYILSIGGILESLEAEPTRLMRHVMEGKHPADYVPDHVLAEATPAETFDVHPVNVDVTDIDKDFAQHLERLLDFHRDDADDGEGQFRDPVDKTMVAGHVLRVKLESGLRLLIPVEVDLT